MMHARAVYKTVYNVTDTRYNPFMAGNTGHRAGRFPGPVLEFAMSLLATRFGRTRTEFRSREPLTEDQIRRYAPSIYAESAHDSRSQRYSYIPTAEVLAGLRTEGFEPFFVAQSKSRIEDRREFTKHMIRLRHRSQIDNAEGANEIILINAHDGTSSYQMLSGFFRRVCANGLICGDAYGDIRLPHKGDVRDRVIEGAFTVLDQVGHAREDIAELQALTLTEDQQLAFATAALELRYDEGKSPIQPHHANTPVRREDAGPDAWRLLNRVQERLVRGGQTSWSERRRQRVTTRAVTGIDQSVKLNRALWVLADEMKKLVRH
jgi:hypothetical protein